MDMCIIQLEMKHCEVGGCQGPSYTNIGVFKNKKQAKQFMKKDKLFKKYFGSQNINQSLWPIAIWNAPMEDK